MWADDKSLNHKTVGEWSVTQKGDTLGYNPIAGARLEPFTPIINPTYTTDHDYFRVKPKKFLFIFRIKLS